jgi:hypothetical protein
MTNPVYAKVYRRALGQDPGKTFFKYGDYIGMQKQVLNSPKTAAIAEIAEDVLVGYDGQGSN